MSVITLGRSPELSLEILALSSHQWRIRDADRAPNDAMSLVGFVAQVGTAYEITLLADPRSRYYCSTLDQAIDYIHSSVAQLRKAS
jgi:hypothetical protein